MEEGKGPIDVSSSLEASLSAETFGREESAVRKKKVVEYIPDISNRGGSGVTGSVSVIPSAVFLPDGSVFLLFLFLLLLLSTHPSRLFQLRNEQL